MTIVGGQLDVLGKVRGKLLEESEAHALAGYLRALSAVKRDRKGHAGKLAGKSVAELLEMAREDPELADVLGAIAG
jgi:hypothetical protein